MIKIKFCGFTNEKDALWAVNLGVDYIGFNFYQNSPRKISLSLAKKIIQQFPSFVEAVGVFVNEPIDSLKKTVKKCNLKIVQLHGDESPEYCAELLVRDPHLQIIKAFRMIDDNTVNQIADYVVTYFLLDAFVADCIGGTGKTFSWDLALKVKAYEKPFFLSGGLTPENVKEAINKVQPWGVDVASGIERTPRRKEYSKMEAFVHAVRSTKI